MPQPFVHLELNTPDLAKAKDFYGQLCGWTFEDNPMPMGVYSLFKPDTGPGGGMYTMAGAPTAWLPYIGVDNIKTATDKATSLGAKVIVNNQEVPGHGWMSVLVDPTGAAIALWQAKA
ncbi:VOC family protein [Edaphobacter bradus]|uniref:VOC family protein n=1 Tax=Edaphobacter bradus TaxID=2259016 RepID=UPI0021DF5678|nr:VOC family protein [Edaphobacter bradus]